MQTRRVLLLTVLLLAAACGDDGDDGDDSTVAAPPSTETTDAVEIAEATTTTTAADDEPATTSAEAPETTTAPAPEPDPGIAVQFREGEVQGGVRTEEVAVGEQVRLSVTSDVADEVHVHGYDLTVDLEPGVAGVIELTADLPGVWEVELEESGTPLLELQVA